MINPHNLVETFQSDHPNLPKDYNIIGAFPCSFKFSTNEKTQSFMGFSGGLVLIQSCKDSCIFTFYLVLPRSANTPKWMQTSKIKSTTAIDNTLIINTSNSVYHFEFEDHEVLIDALDHFSLL